MALLTTKRLILRQWNARDFELFSLMNSDPRVMEFFASPPSPEQSIQQASEFAHAIKTIGWGLWAVEVRGGAPFIGFIGLNQVAPSMPFSPAVEIGWRLAYDFWKQGYATEGAKACLDYAFCRLALEEVVAFTATGNERSRRVMEKLGMHRDLLGDFDHPRSPAGHPLTRQVLYRISPDEWTVTKRSSPLLKSM